MGKRSPAAFSASQSRIALSHVSQGTGRAVGTGALRHEVGQLGAYRPRAYAQMEGQMLGVDTQVAMHP